MSTIAEGRNVRAWLYKIATNVCLIVETTTFTPDMFPAFGLPLTLAIR